MNPRQLYSITNINGLAPYRVDDLTFGIIPLGHPDFPPDIIRSQDSGHAKAYHFKSKLNMSLNINHIVESKSHDSFCLNVNPSFQGPIPS
jgi:hypothetical protein